MSSIDTELTVGELVARMPVLAQVMEHYGIEYCCQGNVALCDAVTEKELELDEVIERMNRAIAAPNQERDWTAAPLDELCEHIVNDHHNFVRDEFIRITKLAEKVARVHGGGHPELIEAEHVFGQLVDEMNEHMAEEEQAVFPIVSRENFADELDSDATATLISKLEQEHTDTADLLFKLRTLLHDFVPPKDACNSYRALLDGIERIEHDTHRHVHKENHVLFPRVTEAVAAAS